MDTASLDIPVKSLEGIGPARAAALEELEVRTLGDLLEYFPRRYQRETEERAINELTDGPFQTARGTVVAVDYVSHPRPKFEATLDDGTGSLACVWWHGAYLRTRIHPGQLLHVRAKVKFFRGLPQMAQPKWAIIDDSTPLVSEAKIRPIYPASAHLPSDALDKLLQRHLPEALPAVAEWFSPDLLKRRSLLPRTEAYQQVHHPDSLRQAELARRRLMYDELMLMQLALQLGRSARRGRITAPLLRIDKLLDQRIRRRFPFDLTGAQVRTIHEVVRDLKSGQPMNRLLQGDVGSGKTVVALYAMLAAVANKLQAVLLAPTEVLAEQHYLTLSNWLSGSQVKVDLLTHRTKQRQRGSLQQSLAEGQTHLAVGTQALLQDEIEFANLGLVVVDEQHKLGVRQRGMLKGKGYSPHYLVMTATPIPRTLALSFFADFDLSILDELPPGRQPIQTRLLGSRDADTAYDFVRNQVSQGRQAYIVVPQIEDGADEVKSIKKEFTRLEAGPLHGLRLMMLHGQMKADQKQQTMQAFRAGQADVLVATTVIEVGIDVPNATVIIIDNAERFGLSQLHQLRGRVGRGSEQSWCILLADTQASEAQQRLETIVHSQDGFEIAEMDLKLRGPGQFFGVRQHGLPDLKLADLSSELQLLEQTREDALKLLKEDPSLSSVEHKSLRQALLKQFGDSLPLAQIG